MLSGLFGGVNARAEDTRDHTFDGRFVVVQAQDSAEPDVELLQGSGETYELAFPSDRRPKPGTTVRVAGRLTGATSPAGPVIAVTSTEPAPPDVQQAIPAIGTTGTLRVLVILAQWTAPDHVTRESARQ